MPILSAMMKHCKTPMPECVLTRTRLPHSPAGPRSIFTAANSKTALPIIRERFRIIGNAVFELAAVKIDLGPAGEWGRRVRVKTHSGIGVLQCFIMALKIGIGDATKAVGFREIGAS